jgi:hypothetical protein
MTRTVLASSGPAAGERAGGSRVRRMLRRALPLAAAALLGVPAVASAAEPTSGYTTPPTTPTTPPPTTPTTPATTPTTPTTPATTPEEPKTGTSPSKEEAPKKEEPAKGAAPEKATTLPFTGFDLRWTLGGGLLLILAGASILRLQRRVRGGSR